MGQPAREPSVSAIIPAFNAEAFVREAVDSVLAQTHPVLECIVVDDGSTDSTAEIARAYGERVQLVQQANRGVATARNRGVAEASGELLAFLDADDRWLPQRLERQLAVLRESTDLEAVVCATEVVDRDLRPLGVIRQDAGLTARDMLLCRASVVSVSSNLLITRAAFDAAGPFDDRLSTSADWGLMLRLVHRGQLGSIEDPLVQYRVHDGNMSADVERFERDMLTAFGDAFSGPNALADLRPLKRRAFANLHRMISGSYFVERRMGRFVRHAARSIAGHPSTLPYFLALPLRRLRRSRGEDDARLTSPRAAGRPRA